MIEGLAAQAATWTDLAVQTRLEPFGSDHVSFIEAGLPGVLTIEGTDQANMEIHGPNDTLDRINDGLAYRILRMNTAYVASLIANASTIALNRWRPRMTDPALSMDLVPLAPKRKGRTEPR